MACSWSSSSRPRRDDFQTGGDCQTSDDAQTPPALVAARIAPPTSREIAGTMPITSHDQLRRRRYARLDVTIAMITPSTVIEKATAILRQSSRWLRR